MATVSAKFRSTSGDLGTHRVTYFVTDATDENDALSATLAVAPATVEGLALSNASYEEVRYPDVWNVTVTYSLVSVGGVGGGIGVPETGDSEYAFEASLETKRVFTSLETIYRGRSDEFNLIDFNKAIAVDVEDKKADGIDIRSPVGSFVISYYPTVATVSESYQNTVLETVGKVNSASFKGFDAGEVLFVGASGRVRNSNDWEIQYRFEVRKNVPMQTISDIPIPAVDGWDIIWIYYKLATDDGGNYIRTPQQVNVERVYERANFATVLGI